MTLNSLLRNSLYIYFMLIYNYSFSDSSHSSDYKKYSHCVSTTVTLLSLNLKMEVKTLVFNGEGDVRDFITKVELYSALKGYTEEKCAQNLASRLEGPAFDVYLRLNQEDKKKVNRLKEELLKEFERGQLNRVEAICTLATRVRKPGESAHTYAYKLLELIKLAYPDFNSQTRSTIAKDYFVRGLHRDMQTALKSMEKFESCDINALADEVTRLQIAGIKSNFHAAPLASSHSVNATGTTMADDMLNSIAERVVEKLTNLSIHQEDGGNDPYHPTVNAAANVVATFPSNPRGGYRNYSSQRRARGNSRGRYRNYPAQQLKCRCCKSSDHLVRNCPTRFCQACGQRGHDSKDTACPNYQ